MNESQVAAAKLHASLRLNNDEWSAAKVAANARLDEMIRLHHVQDRLQPFFTYPSVTGHKVGNLCMAALVVLNLDDTGTLAALPTPLYRLGGMLRRALQRNHDICLNKAWLIERRAFATLTNQPEET